MIALLITTILGCVVAVIYTIIAIHYNDKTEKALRKLWRTKP